MIKQIETQLNKLILLLIVIIGFTTLSCLNKKLLYMNICKADLVNEATQDMILAYEISIPNKFTLVDDGFDQIFRLSPSFVILDTKNFISSYDTGIIMFPIENINNFIDTNVVNLVRQYNYADSLLNNHSNTDYIDFKNRKFNRKIRNYFKHLDVNHLNKALFRYSFFKIRAKIKFYGNTSILLPVLNYKEKGVIRLKDCKTYYLYDIERIEPYNKK